MGSRQPPLSNTERASVIASLVAGVRMDGRALLETRPVSLDFGKDFGSCVVCLGATRVLAQVTCEVVEPRPSRPNEGRLVFNVHVNPMAGQEFEQGRTNDIQDELQQLLDNNVRESRCIDLEALCIVAEESVWQLKTDVTVLNACGNMADACNMAAVAALKHSRRPDVSVQEGDRVVVHSASERELIPTFLKKIPVCLTYAFCETLTVEGTQPPTDDDSQQPSEQPQQSSQKQLLVFTDPTNVEEKVVRGRLVVGLNPHGEVTSLHFPGVGGGVTLDRATVRRCVADAFCRARDIAELMEKAVLEDEESRVVVRPTQTRRAVGMTEPADETSTAQLGQNGSSDAAESDSTDKETVVKTEVMDDDSHNYNGSIINKENKGFVNKLRSDESINRDTIRVKVSSIRAVTEGLQQFRRKLEVNVKDIVPVEDTCDRGESEEGSSDESSSSDSSSSEFSDETEPQTSTTAAASAMESSTSLKNKSSKAIDNSDNDEVTLI